jgi:hypothetical protein
MPTFNDAIIPTGTIDGSNVTFTLPSAPNPPESLLVNSDSSILAPAGVGFTLTGTSLVLVAPPVATLIVWYRT